MSKKFHLLIQSPAEQLYQGDIQSLTAPGELGGLGILADHAPLISRLKPGTITFRGLDGETVRIPALSAGFLEVNKNKVTILLD